MYLIARYSYLFNYDEKYSNKVVNLSRRMLITCVCSVSIVLKTCVPKLSFLLTW